MEFRPLQLTIRNARDLKDVNHFSKMDPYVIVSISGDPRSMQKTPVHNNGGTNPAWEFPMSFTVDDNSLGQNRLTLHFKIKEYSKLGDKDIGEVVVPLKELFDSNKGEVSYGVRTMSGKAKGTLNFSYKFGDKFSAGLPENKSGMMGYPPATAGKSGEPVMAYPPPPVGYAASASGPGAYGYPPPQNAGYGNAGYPYPPPGPGYGYQPPPPSYQQPFYGYPGQPAGYHGQQAGYPGKVKPPKKSGGMGGLGLGLGAGLLGGLLLGEAVDGVDDAAAYADGYSDAADMYDGGFDF